MDHQLHLDFNCENNTPQEESSISGVLPKIGSQYEALLAYRRASSCYVQTVTRQAEHLDLLERDVIMAALQTLMLPIKGETRKLYVFDREMILLDKFGVGGVPIEQVDDITAVFHFLDWLHNQKQSAELKKTHTNRRKCDAALKGGV